MKARQTTALSREFAAAFYALATQLASRLEAPHSKDGCADQNQRSEKTQTVMEKIVLWLFQNGGMNATKDGCCDQGQNGADQKQPNIKYFLEIKDGCALGDKLLFPETGTEKQKLLLRQLLKIYLLVSL